MPQPEIPVVDLKEVAESIDLTNQEMPAFLDLQTGEVLFWCDPSVTGEENEFDPEDDRFAPLPVQTSRDGYVEREEFARSAGETVAAAELLNALGKPKPYRAFKEVLRAHPELEKAWFHFHAEHLRQIARKWLRATGIEYRDPGQTQT